jgi:hypothetical protein
MDYSKYAVQGYILHELEGGDKAPSWFTLGLELEEHNEMVRELKALLEEGAIRRNGALLAINKKETDATN